MTYAPKREKQERVRERYFWTSSDKGFENVNL
jgi:hypothetical protein